MILFPIVVLSFTVIIVFHFKRKLKTESGVYFTQKIGILRWLLPVMKGIICNHGRGIKGGNKGSGGRPSQQTKERKRARRQFLNP